MRALSQISPDIKFETDSVTIQNEQMNTKHETFAYLLWVPGLRGRVISFSKFSAAHLQLYHFCLKTDILKNNLVTFTILSNLQSLLFRGSVIKTRVQEIQGVFDFHLIRDYQTMVGGLVEVF